MKPIPCVPHVSELLRVSTVTLHRWLKQGRLPAYHVGPRHVRIRRQDLGRVLTQIPRGDVYPAKERIPIQTELAVMPLSDEDAKRVDEFLERSESLMDRIRDRRHGKPLPPSWPLIRKSREERSKKL